MYELFAAGSSTIIAREKAPSRSLGMEIEHRDCDVIRDGWQNCTGTQAILDSEDPHFR
jgi:hypothetical protein